MNEAGEYMKKIKKDKWNLRKPEYYSEYQIVKAVNKALEQVGKEAKEKLTLEAFKVIESSPVYQDGFVDALKEADEILDKIINSLKL